MKNSFPIRTDLHAGYRPVRTMVFPDQLGYWVPGWFDLDSLNICGSVMGAGGVSGYGLGAGGSAEPGAAGTPPAPPAP